MGLAAVPRVGVPCLAGMAVVPFLTRTNIPWCCPQTKQTSAARRQHHPGAGLLPVVFGGDGAGQQADSSGGGREGEGQGGGAAERSWRQGGCRRQGRGQGQGRGQEEMSVGGLVVHLGLFVVRAPQQCAERAGGGRVLVPSEGAEGERIPENPRKERTPLYHERQTRAQIVVPEPSAARACHCTCASQAPAAAPAQ